MGWQLKGFGSSTEAKVDAPYNALRVSTRPFPALVWTKLAFRSGNLATLAAGAAVLSVRNIGPNRLAVRRVALQTTVTTGFTAAQILSNSVTVARQFNTSDTGGTAYANVGNNGHSSATFPPFTAVDIRHATTAALGAGTKNIDTTALGTVDSYATAAGVGAILSKTNLLETLVDGLPVMLQTNEGINIFNNLLMGAGGVINQVYEVEVAEVLTDVFI